MNWVLIGREWEVSLEMHAADCLDIFPPRNYDDMDEDVRLDINHLASLMHEPLCIQ